MIDSEKDLLAGLGSSLVEFLKSLPTQQKKALFQVLGLSLKAETASQLPNLDEFFEGAEQEPGSGPSIEEFIGEVENELGQIKDLYTHSLKFQDVDQKNNLGILNMIFRELHHIKGLSALFGFTEFTRLANQLENYFDGLRVGNPPLTEEMFVIFKRCFEAMQNSLHAAPDQIGSIPELQFLEAELSNLPSQKTKIK